MIHDRPTLTPDEIERLCGWVVGPEGACKGDSCVELPPERPLPLNIVADRLGMPLVHDERHRLWCLGPESGARTLPGAWLPEIVLPDIDGTPFDLATLRGSKVLLVAWASW